MTTIAPAPRRQPSLLLPLVLIGVGVALLLGDLGYARGIAWSDAARLWPVLLVLVGADLLIRPRSYLAAAIVEVAIIVAALAYLYSSAPSGAASAAYSFDLPREGATELALTANYGGGTLAFSGGATGLVSVSSSTQDVSRSVTRSGTRADVTLSSRSEGLAFDGRDRSWEVQLPSDLPTALTLNLGAGRFDVDLSRVRVTRATINAGASDLTVGLPAPSGDVRVAISAGASDLKIVVPAGVAYRVETTGVLHSVSGPLVSPGYATATDRVTVNVSVAMGAVSVR